MASNGWQGEPELSPGIYEQPIAKAPEVMIPAATNDYIRTISGAPRPGEVYLVSRESGGVVPDDYSEYLAVGTDRADIQKASALGQAGVGLASIYNRFFGEEPAPEPATDSPINIPGVTPGSVGSFIFFGVAGAILFAWLG